MADTAWKLTLEGQVYREYDLTLDDIEAMEQATGLSWRHLNPMQSAATAKEMAIVILVRRGGMAEDDARKVIGDMTAHAFMDALTFYDPDDEMPTEYQNGIPPLADGT